MTTPLDITRLVLGELDTNCWTVSDGSGGPLVVIDPAAEPERVLDAIGGRQSHLVLAAVAVTVAMSVLAHGLSAGPLATWYSARHPADEAPAVSSPPTA